MFSQLCIRKQTQKHRAARRRRHPSAGPKPKQINERRTFIALHDRAACRRLLQTTSKRATGQFSTKTAKTQKLYLIVRSSVWGAKPPTPIEGQRVRICSKKVCAVCGMSRPRCSLALVGVVPVTMIG